MSDYCFWATELVETDDKMRVYPVGGLIVLALAILPNSHKSRVSFNFCFVVSRPSQSIKNTSVWTTCPYKARDGLFNPDARMVNDIGNFQSLSDAVLYNTIAWRITNTSDYAESAGEFVPLSLRRCRGVACYFGTSFYDE